MKDEKNTISTAAALIKSQDFEKAINLLCDFLETNPNNEIGTGMLASVYAEIKMFDKAIDLYDKILNVNSDNILARFHLGLIHFNKADFRKAIDTWEPAISDPSDFMVKYFTGLAFLNVEELNKGINLLIKASELMPSDHPLHEQLSQQLDAANKLN